jgi:hypothetical protein
MLKRIFIWGAIFCFGFNLQAQDSLQYLPATPQKINKKKLFIAIGAETAFYKGMTFIKLPFPTLEFNSKGGWKGYWIYF